jgi:signal transduction histidine kinase
LPYHAIDDPAKLRRILEASLLLEADLDLPTLLRHVVEEAQSVTSARFGALGVLNDDRTGLSEFITVGLPEEQERRIGSRPTGKGVLGLLINDPHPIRLARLGDHPASYGFPANHPPMGSFLGVPIVARDETYGILYLTDKVGWSEFTADDESLVGALAVTAGIAIENARLHARAQEVVIYEERDRLARDLHDTVIQRLFAVGLSLQSMVGSTRELDTSQRLQQAIEDIDVTIKQVRTTIFELGESGLDVGLRSRVLSVARELTPVLGFDVGVSFDGPIDTVVSEAVADHLMSTIREALTNIGRHAGASEASLTLSTSATQCRLEVGDDGVGIDGSRTRPTGLGLNNLRRRAEKLDGTMEILSPRGGGTTLIWQVPLGE